MIWHRYLKEHSKSELLSMMLKERIQIFERFKKKNPYPKCELNFKSNFELLIAVMLSAQTTDISVNAVTLNLFKAANTPAKMVKLSLEEIKEYIRTIGLFNTKAKNVLAISHALLEKYDGQVPADREALEKLPGVGRKTANVVLNTAFGEPTLAVDTHVFRVSNRIGLVKATTPLAVEMSLLQVIPKPYLKDAHHWLIIHGRYTCVARKPKCHECIIVDICKYTDKNI